jgi:hypothetical protein
MPICNDPAITYLKTYGYSVLRLPRRDFQPLQILASQGKDLVPLGDLATVMVGDGTIPLPTVRPNVEAATINGQRSSDLSVGVGLNILGGVIGAMGGGNLGLDASYSNAKSVAFEFSNVLMDDIAIAKLDQFLATADINRASKHVSELLDADDIYVITATIKSAKFTISAKQKSGTNLAVDVPTIQGVVGGKVKVTAGSEATGLISYEGTEPLVFGFQAVRLFYDGGKYSSFKPLEAGAAAGRKLLPMPKLPDGVETLSTPGPFARLTI